MSEWKGTLTQTSLGLNAQMYTENLQGGKGVEVRIPSHSPPGEKRTILDLIPQCLCVLKVLA